MIEQPQVFAESKALIDLRSLLLHLRLTTSQLNLQGYVIQNQHGMYLGSGENFEFFDSLSNAELLVTLEEAQDTIQSNLPHLKGCVVKYVQAKLAFDVSEVPAHG